MTGTGVYVQTIFYNILSSYATILARKTIGRLASMDYSNPKLHNQRGTVYKEVPLRKLIHRDAFFSQYSK